MVQSNQQFLNPAGQVVTQGGSSYRESRRAPWSPAQLVAAAAGIVLIVIGGVALARAGLHLSPHVVPLTRTQVAGLGFTSMSGLIQVIVGVLLLGGGAYPDTARSTMAVLGVVLLAFGLIVAIDPTPFSTMWGFTTASGVFYTIVGAIVLIVAAVSPTFFSRRKVVAQSTDAYADSAPVVGGVVPVAQGPVAQAPVVEPPAPVRPY
jgi:hypothetical protein